jgi:hypothetical protein
MPFDGVGIPRVQQSGHEQGSGTAIVILADVRRGSEARKSQDSEILWKSGESAPLLLSGE